MDCNFENATADVRALHTGAYVCLQRAFDTPSQPPSAEQVLLSGLAARRRRPQPLDPPKGRPQPPCQGLSSRSLEWDTPYQPPVRQLNLDICSRWSCTVTANQTAAGIIERAERFAQTSRILTRRLPPGMRTPSVPASAVPSATMQARSASCRERAASAALMPVVA